MLGMHWTPVGDGNVDVDPGKPKCHCMQHQDNIAFASFVLGYDSRNHTE